jgi:hypothetical protein
LSISLRRKAERVHSLVNVAMFKPPHARRPRRWIPVLAVLGTAVALVGVSSGLAFLRPSNRPVHTIATPTPLYHPRSAAATTMPATPTGLSTPGSSARYPLRVWGSTITADRSDTQFGAFTYVRIRMWTVGAGPTDAGMFEEQHWRAGDASGRVTVIRPAGEHYGETPGTTNYPPGGLRAVVDEPMPANAALLARAFSSDQPTANGPQFTVRAVATSTNGSNPAAMSAPRC